MTGKNASARRRATTLKKLETLPADSEKRREVENALERDKKWRHKMAQKNRENKLAGATNKKQSTGGSSSHVSISRTKNTRPRGQLLTESSSSRVMKNGPSKAQSSRRTATERS
jgi:hypothetical protein